MTILNATRRRLISSGLLGSLAIVATTTFGTGIGRADDTTGITDKKILVGQTMPYSGPVSFASANGVGDLAFLKMLNEQGGINGRELELLSLDDGYSPPKTMEQTRKLVEDDKVAFIYSTLGTPTNSAIAKYLTDRKIPHILFNTGTDKFYSGEYPVYVPYFPRYKYQAEVLARWILKEKPDAKIAFLYQNDDFGRNFLDGVKEALGDKAGNVVKAVSFEVRDPSVDSQVISLAETKADILFVASVPGRPVSQALRKAADLGWKPISMLPLTTNGTETVLRPGGIENAVGAISAAFMKDPTDPTLQNDPEVMAWNAWMDKYIPGDPKRKFNNSYWFPYLKGWMLKAILEHAGKNPTRESILKAATSLPKMRVPLMLDGVTIEGTPELKTMNIIRFDGKRWEPIGEPMTAGTK
jgi:branched-chain amino acid transport system substrate-binding protein